MSILKYTVDKMIEEYINQKAGRIDARIKTMKFRRAQLKVKIKSLAKEAVIIREEERKAKARGDKQYSKIPADQKIRSMNVWSQDYPEGWATYQSLYEHRVRDVRREARHAQLAYGFLRGVPYKKMEQNCRWDNQPDWNRVRRISQVFLGLKNNHSEFDKLYHEKFKEWSGYRHLLPLVSKPRSNKTPAPVKGKRFFQVFG